MVDHTRHGTERRFGPLVTGLLDDVQVLLSQHLDLFKAEVKEDLRGARDATVALSAGLIVAFMGAFFLLFMVVHLLHLIPGLPLWACYGIVGGLATLGGMLLLARAKQRFDDVTPPVEQTVEELKEDVQWAKTQL
jgi:hypothetical protein